MQVFSFSISDCQDTPDVATGLVRAATEREALARLGDPRANVYALPAGFLWPPEGQGLHVLHDRDRMH